MTTALDVSGGAFPLVLNASGVVLTAYNPATQRWCGVSIPKLAEALVAIGGLGAGSGLPAGGGADKVLGWDPTLNSGAGGPAWQGSSAIDQLGARLAVVNNTGTVPITMLDHGNAIVVLLGTGPVVFDWGATGDGFLARVIANAGDVPFSVTGTGTTKVMPAGATLSKFKGGDKFGSVVTGWSPNGAEHLLTFAGAVL